MGGSRRGWGWVLSALVLVSGPKAQAATQTRLVIVPHQASSAAPAVAALASALAGPLAPSTVVLAPITYQQAAQAARLGPRAATNSAQAVRLGSKVGASHILYLRTTSETLQVSAKRKRARERLTLTAVLVDTTTGESLMSRRYIATARGIGTPELRKHVADDVAKALSQATAPQAVAQKTTPAAVSAPTASPTAATPTDAAPAPELTHDAAPSPVAAPPADSALSAATDPMAHPPVPALATAQRAAPQRMPLGIRAHVGLQLYNRQATLSTLGATQLQYGVGVNGPAPVFSRGILQAEVFPVLMARRHQARRFVDGLGLHLAASLGRPATRIAGGKTATSQAVSLRGGLTLRHLFGAGPKAPELAFRLGYSQYTFAMANQAPFPGLRYSALYLNIGGELPVGTPKVALVAEGALLPAMRLGSDAAKLGVQRGQSLGAWVQAGVRYSPVSHLDILALFDWEHYGAKFVGSTLLPYVTRQYASVTLKETLIGGRVAVGVTF
jgi:hypothetical protein